MQLFHRAGNLDDGHWAVKPFAIEVHITHSKTILSHGQNTWNAIQRTVVLSHGRPRKRQNVWNRMMKTMKLFTAVIAGLLLAVSSTAAKAEDIVGIAAGNKDFSTLVTAVKAAGLVETLQGEGPFTVFAPTNAAFAKLPKATLEALLKDKKALTAILTYHVVAGKVMAADVVKLKDGTKVKTVNGAEVKIGTKKGVKVNDSNVVKTDIEASNGVIHVIDTVLIPKAKK